MDDTINGVSPSVFVAEHIPEDENQRLRGQIRRIAMERIADGTTDPDEIQRTVLASLRQDSRFGSILLTIGLTILAMVIKEIVLAILREIQNRIDSDPVPDV